MQWPFFITFPYSLLFIASLILAFVPEWRLFQRTGSGLPSGAHDRGSRWVLLFGNGLAFGLSFVVALFIPATEIGSGAVESFAVGIALILAGSLLRIHSMKMLGRWFTTAVAVQPNQHVVQRGAYRWVRHPSYSGSMVILVGVGLAQSNWLSVLILTVIPSITFSYRAWVEERLLRDTVGTPYDDYMRRSKRFVPFCY